MWNNSTLDLWKEGGGSAFDVVKFQFVVKGFAVDAQQLGGTALVVAGLTQGVDDVLLFGLFVAQRHGGYPRSGGQRN